MRHLTRTCPFLPIPDRSVAASISAMTDKNNAWGGAGGWEQVAMILTTFAGFALIIGIGAWIVSKYERRDR